MTPAKGPAAITVERKVEWSDTDASGHHHFTAILRWAEQAECALQEHLGIADLVSGHCPRVHVSVDFKHPAYAREVVEIDLSVHDVGRTSVRYAFSVRGGDETVAEGDVTAVFVREGRPTRWPEDVRRRLLHSGRVASERYASSPFDGNGVGTS